MSRARAPVEAHDGALAVLLLDLADRHVERLLAFHVVLLHPGVCRVGGAVRTSYVRGVTRLSVSPLLTAL